jgi:hypothetical protein
MCADASNAGGSSGAHVPHFASVGFGGGGDGAGGGGSADANRLAEAHANLDLKAMNLQVCVGASYDPATNKICFTVPVYGQFCIDSPVHIPGGGDIQACVQTCGSLIPTGLKATVYLNGSPIITVTLFGFC